MKRGLSSKICDGMLFHTIKYEVHFIILRYDMKLTPRELKDVSVPLM